MNGQHSEMKISEKYVLTIDEAAIYFHIGINKLHRLVNEHKDADWVLWNASHSLIKRKKFEQFIDSIDTI